LSNSILKYLGATKLKPVFQQKPDENKVEGAPPVLSLAERIKMREQSGDLNTFNETYSTLKTTKSFDEIGIFTKSENRAVMDNGKRKSDYDMDKDLKKPRRKALDDDDYVGGSDSDDDIRLVQSQPVLLDITNNNQSTRPKRKSITSKKLVLSEEEDKEASDDDFLLPTNI
jgi:hypothetical protein